MASIAIGVWNFCTVLDAHDCTIYSVSWCHLTGFVATAAGDIALHVFRLNESALNPKNMPSFDLIDVRRQSQETKGVGIHRRWRPCKTVAVEVMNLHVVYFLDMKKLCYILTANDHAWCVSPTCRTWAFITHYILNPSTGLTFTHNIWLVLLNSTGSAFTATFDLFALLDSVASAKRIRLLAFREFILSRWKLDSLLHSPKTWNASYSLWHLLRLAYGIFLCCWCWYILSLPFLGFSYMCYLLISQWNL